MRLFDEGCTDCIPQAVRQAQEIQGQDGAQERHQFGPRRSIKHILSFSIIYIFLAASARQMSEV